MNQIILSKKLIVTKELLRKKKIYKIQFIVSFILSVILIGIYCFIQVSLATDSDAKDILQSLSSMQQIEDPITSEPIVVNLAQSDNVDYEDYVNENQEEDQDNEELEESVFDTDDEEERLEILNRQVENQVEDKINSVQNQETTQTNVWSNNSNSQVQVVTTQSGASYQTNLTINIPSINCNYPILIPEEITNEAIEKALKSSVVKFWGPEITDIGNYCIVGHNYRNSKFFSRVPTLEIGALVQIIDLNGNIYNYTVYDKYTVSPSDNDCTDQRTNGRRELTLITCTNDSKQRYIIKCYAI